jgi:hypothetical protein
MDRDSTQGGRRDGGSWSETARRTGRQDALASRSALNLIGSEYDLAMPRRNGPVPYELIGRTRGWSTLGSRPVDSESAPIGPGRAVRVPAGYLLIAAVAIVAVMVGVFAWGFSRGEAAARSATARTLEAAVAARSVRDPLGGGEALQRPRDLDGTEPAGASPPSRDWQDSDGRVTGDPRRVGLNYFVLAHATVETSPDLVAFCRNQGLEAHVVADHNGALRKVIVTPGYADGARRSETVQALERRIRDVGLSWKAQRRGNADFSGAYPELFRGVPRSE